MLDLYAGTGALAFEALSRGADSAVLVERDRAVARVLAESATELGFAPRVRVEVLDLHTATRSLTDRLRRLGGRPFELVFVDPPYVDVDQAIPVLRALIDAGLLAQDAVVVLEHAKKKPPGDLGPLACVAGYEYGDTAVALLVPFREPEVETP